MEKSRNHYRSLVDLPLCELMSAADDIRAARSVDKVELCGIVNARSGICPEDCRFCAQSAHNEASVPEYPLLSPETILEKALKVAEAGAKRVGIVTSGRSLKNHEVKTVADSVVLFQDNNIYPCASLGELSAETIAVLKDSGLRRYHHNLETSERFYPAIVTTHSYSDRVRTVETAKRSGLEVCSGGIFGLGENWDDRIDMALLLKSLEVDSVPLNFLVPVEGTPMAFHSLISPEEALRIIALYRIILERSVIRIAAGREAIFGDRQSDIFSAGAEGMMVGGYLTVKGTDPAKDMVLVGETQETWKKRITVP